MVRPQLLRRRRVVDMERLLLHLLLQVDMAAGGERREVMEGGMSNHVNRFNTGLESSHDQLKSH